MGLSLSTGWEVLPNPELVDYTGICYWQEVAGPLTDGSNFKIIHSH